MRASSVGTGLALAISAVGVAVQVAQWAGVTFDAALASVADSSRVWLPISTLVLGMFVGLAVGRRLDAPSAGRRAGIAAPTTGAVKRSAPPTASTASAASLAEDDPLSALLPVEVPFVLRAYDEAQVHVGMGNLKVAESLHAKGVVLRADAPDSGVIAQCDVRLTKEWACIVREREGELRAAAS